MMATWGFALTLSCHQVKPIQSGVAQSYSPITFPLSFSEGGKLLGLVSAFNYIKTSRPTRSRGRFRSQSRLIIDMNNHYVPLSNQCGMLQPYCVLA